MNEESGRAADQVIGVLQVDLDRKDLEKEENTWWTLASELSPSPGSRLLEAPGNIDVMLCWEPWRTRQVSKCLCALLGSHKAASIAGTAQIYFAGFLALIAWRMRWLCTGSHLATCVDVDVPGAALCAF